MIAKLNLIIVIISCCMLLSCKTKDTKEELEFAVVNRSNMEVSVTATASVEPITQVDVGTQVSGIISNIYADYNSIVKKGEVIAELDKINLEAELAVATADLMNTKNEYEYQKKNFERIKSLFEQKTISESEYDDALYAHNKAKNSYDRSQASIIKARTNLSYATIYSPIDGVVLLKSIDVGQTVASSLNTPTLFIIANNLEDMQLIADVDEADIGSVKEGMDVDFTVDAFPDMIFKGKVTQIRLVGVITNNVVTYEVVISAPNPDLLLKPGLTANVNIFSMREDNVLSIPISAVSSREDMPRLKKGSLKSGYKRGEGNMEHKKGDGERGVDGKRGGGESNMDGKRGKEEERGVERKIEGDRNIEGKKGEDGGKGMKGKRGEGKRGAGYKKGERERNLDGEKGEGDRNMANKKGEENNNGNSGDNRPARIENDSIKFVRLYKDGKIELKRIKVGCNDGVSYQVLKGLSVGDTIVVGVRKTNTGANKNSTKSTENPFMPKRPSRR